MLSANLILSSIDHKMPCSNRMTTGATHKLVLLLVVVVVVAAAISVVAAAAHVDSFSYPAFDATTTQDLVAGTNTSVLTSASLLFDHDGAFAEFNHTEGFLLLSRTVDIWRSGPDGGVPAFEASFNTSFALSGGAAAPVAFVVLKDSYPPLYGRGGLRGFANYSASDAADGATPRNASGSLASVEVGPVRSYGPDNPAVGLNVTVTPNGTVAARAVWIEYDAAGHRLSVYVAGAGEARPAVALLDARLGLAGQRTTEKAMVGFFASTIQDILVGVRGWNLTVDRFDSSGGGGRKKGAAWWVILLAVLGSVAATA
ncbi:unnamed protein product [Miscanthus lutarioriparius]|uniref:Legume lectin domain-containing protein n=1 Tax=Miscanthus lutarioriparius TaxID=422564 RepID=A0A811QR20_9POAL|nr:unnamed protein product [Miscanthus lutarioriparius]